MNNLIRKIIVGILTATVLFSAYAYAGITVTGTGDSIGIDTSGFPKEMVEHYQLMENKCKQCHSLERVVVAIQTGLGPISGDVFDLDTSAAYGARMLTRPNSKMKKEEVSKVVSLLDYLIVQAEQ